MVPLTGGDLVVRMLARAGVEATFALHGAHVESLFQACRRHGVRLVDVRHECAAGFAAEAYARLNRRLGVAVVTAGPGFTNIVTSIANAFEDKTPVLYLTGSAHLVEAESNALQGGIDQVAVVRPITKWAHRIIQPQQIPRLVAQAIRIATSDPQGPVLLDIPMDVLHALVDDTELRPVGPVLLEQVLQPAKESVTAALNLLRAAQRPVILAGQGVYQSHGEAELLRFAEQSGIPMFVDTFAHGLFPSDHPLYGGSFYKLAELAEPQHRPDVVLAVGVRFGLSTGNTTDTKVPWAACIIHIDTDAKEIGRTRPAEVGMLASPKAALTALSLAVGSQPLPAFAAWADYVREAMTRRRAATRAFVQEDARIHPAQAVEALLSALPPDTILVSDGAEISHWMDELIRQTMPGSYLAHGAFGCMGIGLGMALGAKVAQPHRPVVCTVGDGSVGFNIAEFDTLVRHELPVIVVVFNNRCWGSSTHYQQRHSGTEGVMGTVLAGARYDLVAAAFGCMAYHLTRVDEIAPAIDAALHSRRPCCINIEIAFSTQPPNMASFGRR